MTISPYASLIQNSIGFDLSEVLEELNQKLLKTSSKCVKKCSKTSIRKIGFTTF